MSNPIDTLAQHRGLILLAEIGAILHDIGKLSPGFIRGVSDSPQQDGPENLHKDGKVLIFDQDVVPSKVRTPIVELVSLQADQLARELFGDHTLADFIEQHHPGPSDTPSYLMSLLVMADQGDSGEDAHTAYEDPRARQRNGIFAASVFGLEKGPLDTGGFDDARKRIWQELKEILAADEDWGERRDRFLGVLEKQFDLTLGKTPRSANDISLWQHSRAVGTRFKAFLAREIAGEQGTNRFRLLGTEWDAWRFIAHVPRLSDAAGRRYKIRQFQEEIRRLVELELAVGNVIYQDDASVVALVADLELETVLKERIWELSQDVTEGEITPIVRLSPATTQVTDIVTWSKGERAVEPARIVPGWTARWSRREGAAVCPICGLRPLQNSSDEHCVWCGHVRAEGAHRRLEETRGTVWTGEIADLNGRLALLVGRFHLDDWLDGTLLHTSLITTTLARAQARRWGQYPTCSLVEALQACVQDPDKLEGPLSIDSGTVDELHESLTQAQRRLDSVIDRPGVPPARVEALKKDLDTTKARVEPELARLQGALLVQEVFSAYGGETDRRLREIAQHYPTDWPFAERYAAALSRKNPSAARLLRVWETTDDFFARAVPDSMQSILENDRALPGNRQRYRHLWAESKRLRIHLAKPSPHLQPGIHTVSISNGHGRTWQGEVFFSRDSDSPTVITIQRLSPTDRGCIEQCKEGGLLEISGAESEKRGFGSCSIPISSISPEEYLPYHLLTTGPEMLLAILPADIAVEVVNRIHESYRQEMGKALGRLPLFMGLCFMDQKSPMYSALDAARRFVQLSRNLGNQKESWLLQEAPRLENQSTNAAHYGLILDPEPGCAPSSQQAVEWRIPCQLGNGEPDFYHPYFILSEPASGQPAEERSSYLRTPAGPIVHVSELCRGDRVRVVPNRFDLLYLDSSARRFDVRPDPETGRRPHPLFGPRYSPRPYLLEELEVLQQVWKWCWPPGMTGTRLHAVRDLLTARFQEWELARRERSSPEWRSFEALAAQVLRKEFGYPAGSPPFQGLHRAVMQGHFFDALELYLQILKEKGDDHE
ncbi:MAG: CRISPR-associated protein Csx11 [Chloroflexia bacterium]|nr:CRISPR-associated protein Csx11 [Chloroflexia bacterium]